MKLAVSSISMALSGEAPIASTSASLLWINYSGWSMAWLIVLISHGGVTTGEFSLFLKVLMSPYIEGS